MYIFWLNIIVHMLNFITWYNTTTLLFVKKKKKKKKKKKDYINNIVMTYSFLK